MKKLLTDMGIVAVVIVAIPLAIPLIPIVMAWNMATEAVNGINEYVAKANADRRAERCN